MPDAAKGARKKSANKTAKKAAKEVGLRSDGTPRRPSYRESQREKPRATGLSRSSTGTPTGASGAARKPGAGATRSRAGLPASRQAAPGARRASATRPASAERRPISPAGRAAKARRDGLPPETGEPERLQKVLAAAGVGPRRACEELIGAGRVTVNGRPAEIGMKVDPINAEIYVDGDRVITDTRRVYLAMNKPAGVVSTMSDDRGRAALADFLGKVHQRVYHVGRLDADSEGLLLLTNDGDLAHRLTHPSYGVPKTYLVEIGGPLRPGLRRILLDGVDLEDGPARVDSFRIVDALGKRVLAEVVIHEGRKHIVRRLLDEVGHPVTRLVRTAIGPIKLGDLRAGKLRRLSPIEIAALFHAVEG